MVQGFLYHHCSFTGSLTTVYMNTFTKYNNKDKSGRKKANVVSLTHSNTEHTCGGAAKASMGSISKSLMSPAISW